MTGEPPQVVDNMTPVSNTDSMRLRAGFGRTLLVALGHWVLQAIVCAIAQYDRVKLGDICIGLISVDTFIHIALLTFFTGAAMRARFLFSWSSGFALLSFGMSYGLCYLSMNTQYRGMFGPKFMIDIIHMFIAAVFVVCFILWILVCWRSELTRNIVDPIGEKSNPTPFQFSLGRLCYFTFLMAIVSASLSQMYDGMLMPSLHDGIGWVVLICYGLLWLICTWLVFETDFSFNALVHANAIAWVIMIAFLALALFNDNFGRRSSNQDAFYLALFILGMSTHFYLSALAYRWAGWRLERFTRRNESIYSRVYRYIMSSR